MEQKRARRRRDLKRMKARAIRVYGKWGNPAGAIKLANHLQHCSRYCCGNPRKHSKELSLQERRAFQCEE